MNGQPPDGRPGGALQWGTLIGIAGIAAAEACGPAGTSDSGGATAAGMTGTWTGTLAGGADSVPIQFKITDDGGALSGDGSFGDPVTGKFTASTGPLTGALTAGEASWTMPLGLAVTGTQSGNSFKGTLQIPPDAGNPDPLVVPLTLKR